MNVGIILLVAIAIIIVIVILVNAVKRDNLDYQSVDRLVGSIPSRIIPDDVSIYDVPQAPVILLIPFGPNIRLGHEITFNFEAAGPILIGTAPDPSSPPPPGTSSVLKIQNTPNEWNSIVFNILPNNLPYPSQPPYIVGSVPGVSSVTFTLIAIGGTSTNQTYFWSGTTTPSKVYTTPGITTIPVPVGSTRMTIAAWGGGGAGGKNGQNWFGNAGGGGGGSSGALSLTQNVSGITSITLNIGAGSKTAGESGKDTAIDFENFRIVAQGGGAGGNGSVSGDDSSSTPAAGGSGGGVQFLQGGQSISPLPGSIIYNGVNGGSGGANSNITTGNAGTMSATGYSGGAGGTLDTIFSPKFLSGPGGGAGGINGHGATAASFYVIIPPNTWGNTNRGSSATYSNGAGGAGEGPNSIPNIANGGDGGAVVIFHPT